MSIADVRGYWAKLHRVAEKAKRSRAVGVELRGSDSSADEAPRAEASSAEAAPASSDESDNAEPDVPEGYELADADIDPADLPTRFFYWTAVERRAPRWHLCSVTRRFPPGTVVKGRPYTHDARFGDERYSRGINVTRELLHGRYILPLERA